MSTKVGADDYIGATGATAAEMNGLPRVELWPQLAPEALYGITGRLVEAVDPYTEADPVATLATFLTAFGNMIGPGPHAVAGRDPHPGRLFTVLAGRTAKARKGMSRGEPMHVLQAVDSEWAKACLASGLSSGEGVIYHVRDPREKLEAIKEKGRIVSYEAVVEDRGVPDKRLLVEEPELASPLKRMDRESNSLSAVLRQAWDRGDLRTLTKNSPLRATGAHISIVAHITGEELRLCLTETEKANGFANRFLYFLVRRSKELPNPQPVPTDVIVPIINALDPVVAWAQGVGTITRDDETERAWALVYSALSADRPGLFGAITARAEAHVLRLSVLYALLDQSAHIRRAHLDAAMAVWAYAEASARMLFGELVGDRVADRIETALKAKGAPMTRDQIRDLFSRNESSERIAAALALLAAQGRARRAPRTDTGPGRPAEMWEAVER